MKCRVHSTIFESKLHLEHIYLFVKLIRNICTTHKQRQAKVRKTHRTHCKLKSRHQRRCRRRDRCQIIDDGEHHRRAMD